jgi:transposase
MHNITIGMDIAKSVFQVHGVDKRTGTVIKKRLARSKLLGFFGKIEASLIGMEACSTAHHWARELEALGHEVKLLPANYVKPYVKRGKNDEIDAEAVWEALERPTMRFVAIKSREQQGVLALHKVRSQLVGQRTRLVNLLRAYMAEFGLVAPQGIWRITELKTIVGDKADERLPALGRVALTPVVQQLDLLASAIEDLDRVVVAHCKSNETSRRLSAIPGIGPITASAFVASVGDATAFKSGRHFAAWLGLTPKQHASGLKDRKGRISKMGNSYLRTLLVLGATAMMRQARRSQTPLSAFVGRLLAKKKSVRLITVALANKMARIVWVLMAKGESYRTA